MKYLYWFGVVAVLALGIFVARSIQFGPQTIPMIPYTQVLSPEELGQQVYNVLESEILKAPHLMLGVTPGAIEDLELWRGFFEAAEAKSLRFDVLMVEPKLPYVEIFPTAAHVDVKSELRRYGEGIRAAREKGFRTAVIVPTIYASQLLKQNPVERLQNEYQEQFLSISVVKFPLTRGQEKEFEPKCIQGEGVDREGTSALGCVILNLARTTYRQKTEPNKLSAQMEKVGPRDYLILLNRNPSN